MARFILNLAELSAGKMGDQSASLSISDLTGIQFNISDPHESESPIDVPAPIVDVCHRYQAEYFYVRSPPGVNDRGGFYHDGTCY